MYYSLTKKLILFFVVIIAGSFMKSCFTHQSFVPAKPPIYCIMITTESRRDFAKVSIRNFHKQQYSNKYLIIINQSDKRVGPSTSDNVLEMFTTQDEDRTLGELRNMGLALVPPDALWTTWDDDDLRSHIYLNTLLGHMRSTNSDVVTITERVEYNTLNGFAYVAGFRSGFMTVLAKSLPDLVYSHHNTLEDVHMRKVAKQKYKFHSIVHNDPTLYVRFVHENNTSPYAKPHKNNVRSTQKGNTLFERALYPSERESLHKILSEYYSKYGV
jgi:hypothetical protein